MLKSYHRKKRVIDLIFASSALILLCPILLFACFVTYIDIGAPVFFVQYRVGVIGNGFNIFKIRTMCPNRMKDHININEIEQTTKVGKLLRRMRLDEIPQLVNVVLGDMSCVGPRPLLAEDQPSNNYMRLLIRPGMTGWAQVNGGELLNKFEKNALDCWYICNASFFVDVYIILLTIKIIVCGQKRNEQQISLAKKWMDSL
jgi:lipopolysaccharide/colanic/teichoic acid biosynthesis glycosyltransferase